MTRLPSLALLTLGALLAVASARAKPPGPHRASPPAKIPDAQTLYLRSLKADDLYSYRGRQITTYWEPGHALAVIVSHRAPDLRRLDTLAPARRRGSSLVSDGRQEWEYDAAAKTLTHRAMAPGEDAIQDAAVAYALLKTNYQVAVIPRVFTWADRKAFVLTITHRQTHALVRKLWIDSATGVVLKREIYRESGARGASKLSVTVAYSDITYRSIPPRSAFSLDAVARRPGVRRLEIPVLPVTSVPTAQAARELGGGALAPPTLAGYQLIAASRAGGRLQLRYSDGLNLVSLFEQRRRQTKRPTQVPAAMRPIPLGRRSAHVFHRASLTVVNWDSDLFNLTLMGEIGQQPLLDLAMALDRR